VSHDIDRDTFRGGMLWLSEHGYPILDLWAHGTQDGDGGDDAPMCQLNVDDVRWLRDALTEWLSRHDARDEAE
jgi:hypothetical protein